MQRYLRIMDSRSNKNPDIIFIDNTPGGPFRKIGRYRGIRIQREVSTVLFGGTEGNNNHIGFF